MAMILLITIVIVLLGFGVFLLIRNHARWLADQSPVGVWEAGTEDGRTLLQFDGDPHEGVYKQVRIDKGSREREFGHWAVQLKDLRMLIVATDVSDHPRFGVDTIYRISYVGPDQIEIDGPGRPRLNFTRTNPDRAVEIDDA